jgi:hypothetical protein
VATQHLGPVRIPGGDRSTAGRAVRAAPEAHLRTSLADYKLPPNWPFPVQPSISVNPIASDSVSI